MTLTKRHNTRLNDRRDIRRAKRLLNDNNVRVFIPTTAQEGGIFKVRKGGADLIGKVSAQGIDAFVAEGALLQIRVTKSGRLYRAIPISDRVNTPRTARQNRTAAWYAADKMFAKTEPLSEHGPVTPIADSPIGWLARRRGADGKPYLTRNEVAAAERLRVDFERSQLAPGVTQNWSRFLTSGVEGGRRVSAQDRDIDSGAGAARERFAEAMEALGPGLSDVALRVCCFIEGIEAIETSMHWSRRSGKVVLKIALQRLAVYYEQISVRGNAAIDAWQSDGEGAELSPV